MNKKQLVWTDVILFFLTFVVFLVSSLTMFISSKRATLEDVKNIANSYVHSLNEGITPEELITYTSGSPIYISFYKDKSTKPFLDSNPVEKEDVDISQIKLISPEIINDSSVGYLVSQVYSYTSGSDSYIRVEKRVPDNYFAAKNFLIYGSMVVFILYVCFVIYSFFNFKKSLVPLKSQIRKLQNIVSSDRPIQYDDDLKYLALIVRDSRKELQEQFELNKTGEQKINFIMDSISQGLVVIDASYKIVMVNKKAMEVFNIPKSEIENKNIEVLRASHALEINLSMAVKTSRSLVCNETINGRIYQCNINPIDYSWTRGNEPNGASLLMIDITEEYNSSKMKKEFFDNASHELKSPLTSMLGYQQMIQQGIITSKDEIDEAINKSIKECVRMNKIIMDMLSLSSLENEELRPVEEIEMSSQISRILDSLEYQINNKHIKIVLSKDPFVIKMNYEDFDRLFRNLIDNAIKYNKESGKITININPKNRTISIKDTGIGLSELDRNRIFERFYRVDKARSRENGGTGLGLAIVKHICNYYEIKVDVISHLGLGTEFILTIPKA